MKSVTEKTHLVESGAAGGPVGPELAGLADLIRAHTPHDGTFPLCVPGAWASRLSRTNTEVVHAVQRPALCIIAQGAKRVMLGQEIYEYDASRMMVYSLDLPLASQITRASRAEPYLSFRLDLDPRKVAELAMKVFPHGPPRADHGQTVCVTGADRATVNAATRLLELVSHPGEADLLAPLVIDEILLRVLRGPGGIRLAQIGFEDSRANGVAKAVAWLRANFSQPVRVEELAELAHMSVSAFHEHFKSVTSMSPLRFQKVLRLQEARRLMLSATMDAAGASRHVGYLSASQFSREYGRFFGDAPTRDIARLRAQGLTVADVSH